MMSGQGEPVPPVSETPEPPVVDAPKHALTPEGASRAMFDEGCPPPGPGAATADDQKQMDTMPSIEPVTEQLSNMDVAFPGGTPTAESEANDDPSVAPGATEATVVVEAPAQPRRKVELNPTGSGKAVPNVGDGSQPMQVPNKGPVEVPRAESLDAGLEAELEAAMSGAATTAAIPSGAPNGIAAGGETANVAATIQSEDQLEPGMKLKAKVQQVTPENTFVDLGFRSPGIIPTRNFPQGKQPHEGEEHLVVVEKIDTEQGLIHVNLTKSTRRPRGNWDELQKGQIVEAYVTGTNKGGLEVAIGQMRAFLPASQVDVGFVASLDTYVGKKFPVEITEVNPAKRNLVVSRKSIVVAERKEAAAVFWTKVEVGQQLKGTVKTIKDYGAFVDLGGVDGFLHVGEMSWTRIKHPQDILSEGQQIDVVVLSIDREKHKIGLGMRQLAQNPWNIAAEKYSVGKNVTGRVTRVTDYGAFVELEPGVEGMIHISELDYKRVKRVGDLLKEGQDIEAQVLEVQPDRQRISLSVKALKPKPEGLAPAPKDEDLAPSKGQAYERKRKEPLRGGTGNPGGGGLFGDPGSYNR